MKTNGQLLQLAHLNDKFKWGNAVWHPKGISPCICEAAGCGGGHVPLIPTIRRKE